MQKLSWMRREILINVDFSCVIDCMIYYQSLLSFSNHLSTSIGFSYIDHIFIPFSLNTQRKKLKRKDSNIDFPKSEQQRNETFYRSRIVLCSRIFPRCASIEEKSGFIWRSVVRLVSFRMEPGSIGDGRSFFRDPVARFGSPPWNKYGL